MNTRFKTVWSKPIACQQCKGAMTKGYVMENWDKWCTACITSHNITMFIAGAVVLGILALAMYGCASIGHTPIGMTLPEWKESCPYEHNRSMVAADGDIEVYQCVARPASLYVFEAGALKQITYDPQAAANANNRALAGSAMMLGTGLYLLNQRKF